MGQAKTTIELNGKLYDASTGAILADGPTKPTTPAKPAAPAPTASSRQVMDGFFRPPAAVPTVTADKATAKTQPKAKRATTANHQRHRKPEHSQTLMRHAVSKPKTARPPATPKQVTKDGLPHPNSLSHDRQKRAEQTARSSSISRFSMPKQQPVDKKLAPLAVQPHPEETDSPPAAPATAAQKQFKQALSTATSHQQAAPAKAKLHHKAARKLGVSHRVVSLGAVGLAAILLIAFVAYQNVPNISMRIASSRAGFHASLPGYTASGFGAAGPIQTSPGTVTVSFKSHSDGRHYQVSQSPSNWNSQALLNNYVASNHKSYQVVEDKGKTVYLYDSSATWVNGGVWYRISGNANLSSQQLVNIANSL